MQNYNLDQIKAVMPQQDPFLFLQSAQVDSENAQALYTISGDEYFLKGHFKDNPVFPATIMLEALGQLGVFFLLKAQRDEIAKPVDKSKIFLISTEDTRCMRLCKPNDVLKIELKPIKIRHPLAYFNAKITVGDQVAATCKKFTLTFDYIQ